MTITLSQHDYWSLFQKAEEQTVSGGDQFDVVFKYPEQLGRGYRRDIQLRDGLDLAIAHCQLHNPVTIQSPEREHPLEYSFYLSGGYRSPQHSVSAEHYLLCGSGTAPKETIEWMKAEQVEVNVHLDPVLVKTWMNQTPDGVPQELQHLIQDPSQRYYVRGGAITGAMQTALQQILHCPFHGITKRIYLESKVWELMALLIEQELHRYHDQRNDQRNDDDQRTSYSLKPDDVDRIHQARAILLQRFDNPPSLIELARQVGLNDCTLKRGFRQVFGTTAFGYLHDYRLEQAKQLLEERQLNVSEIAHAIGFSNRSYFAAAFRKKFGATPREYLSKYRNSA